MGTPCSPLRTNRGSGQGNGHFDNIYLSSVSIGPERDPTPALLPVGLHHPTRSR
jgi:hypothetical protein